MFELMDTCPQNAVIKVIGVGGGGGNAVEHMVKSSIEGVEFVCANTDAQALRNCSTRTVLQLGASITKGLGAGANPDVGRQAAMEDRDRILEVIEGADMLFITAGMGGGTGTGGAPIVAQAAKELGILTVAVVTKPFPFEGKKRLLVADQGIKELSQYVDSLSTVRTSAKSTLIKPGRVINSAIPWTAPCNTLFAALNTSSNETLLPSTDSSFSLGMVMSESTYCDSSLMP